MKKRPAIQKFIAALLLLVFSISIAPKSYFHDLVANHKDVSNCKQLHHSAVLHKQSINCHFDDLVVSAPFNLLPDQPASFANSQPAKKHEAFYSSFFQNFFQHPENRGPPAA